MQTIAETPHFIRRATSLLSEEERNGLIDWLADNPLAGDLLAGTGGVRKVRFGKGSKGKSGGVRVIYYYYDAEAPLYLLDIFGKNEKANLSKAERNELAKLVAVLKQTLRGERHEQESF